jgi:regulator of RNase E activity RraB
MDRLSPIEDTLWDRAERHHAQPVGRLRSRGVWQVSVYGPRDLPWSQWVRELVGTDVELQCQEDVEFAYLNDFLLPDAERHQWILDRRVCDQLAQGGDEPSLQRLVDHFIEYEDSAPPELIAELEKRGFDVTNTGDGLECAKVHEAVLDTVHELTTELSRLAEQHDCAYIGWACPVTRPGGPAN